MSALPRITVITASYNQGHYIEKTIRSVIDQNYPNLEYMVIDGGSTDSTLSILEKYKDHFAYCVSEKDRGQAHAINKGFQRATGDILTWLNSDDWFEPDTFKTVVETFNANPGTEVIIGNCTMVYEGEPEKNFVDKPGRVDLRRMLRYWQPFFCPPQPSIFFKKSLLDKVGPLDESLTYAMDLDLWLRMSRHQSFPYVDKNLSFYLIHGASKSGSGNGFEKFKPEWRKVALEHMRKSSLKEKLYFYKASLLNR